MGTGECKGRLAKEEKNSLTGQVIALCCAEKIGDKQCPDRDITFYKGQLTPVCKYQSTPTQLAP